MSAYCYCNIGLHLWIVTAVLVCLTVDVHQVASATEARKFNSSKVVLLNLRDDSKLEETLSTGKGFPKTFVALKGNAPQEAEGSATSQKITRQIFSEDEPGRGSSGRRQPSLSEQSNDGTRSQSRPREEFNGFPEDFTDGLKLFEFQDNSKKKSESPSGFVDFPKDGSFSSFASQLGGLQPFPPLSSSSSTTRGSTSPSSSSVTRGSQFSADDVSPTSTRGPSNSFQLGSTRKLPKFQNDDENFGDGGAQRFSSQEENDGFPQRSSQRRPATGFRDDFALDDGQDIFVDVKGGRGRHAQGSTADEKPVRAPSSDNDFGEFGDERRPSLRNREFQRRPVTNEDFEPFDQRFDAEPDTFSRPSKSDDFATTGRIGSSEDDRRVQFPKRFRDDQEDSGSSISSTKTSKPPKSNFRDLNQFQLTSSQNFIPVAQFHNGPFPFPQQFGGFRPIIDAAQSPPVRNFRHVAPPQFFITSGGQFDGNGFFENGGGGGSPPDFGRGPSQAAPNFDRPQQDFRPQQFRFQHQQPSHQSHRSHQRPAQQQNNFHSDDTTTHHSSATNNILGSGNFGIIRGGIFADDENPPQNFRPQFHGNHHGGGNGPEDFFHGFRDFQPFGGPLNNALTVNSHNIQNAGTKTETVTVKSETEKPTTTTKKSV